MSGLTLSAGEKSLLAALVGRRLRLLVWDINAVYGVCADGTTKVETVVRVPPSPAPHEFDEAMCLSVGTMNGPDFRVEGEPGFWYKVVSRDVAVESIELVRATIQMPDGSVVDASVEPPPN